MAQQDRDNLPEGTDKIIAGASGPSAGANTGTGAGASPAIGGSGGMSGGTAGSAGTSGGGTSAGAAGPAAGSSGGGDVTVVADTALLAEIETATPSSQPSGAAPSSSAPGADRGTGGGILERVRSGGEKISGQAAGKARDWVGQGLERSGDALANVSRLIGDTAPGLEERLGPEYGEYARRAAEAIERTAQSIASKDPDELIDDTRDFVRKSPGVALAGAAIVGFALARLVKTGLDAASGSNERDAGSTRDGSGSGA